jgi:hypothetical protein
MKLENEAELGNTRKLLEELQEQIARAKSRPQTPENAESLQSLVRTANQLREEIVRYHQSLQRRQAS